jgi:hypothetical protein
MKNLFNPIPIYAKLYFNRMEITRLDNGRTISRNANQVYSDSNLLISNFYNAELLFRDIITEVIPKFWIFSNPFVVLFQQLEEIGSNLSKSERKSLIDLAEFAGAKKVIIVEHSDKLSNEEALNIFENQKNA